VYAADYAAVVSTLLTDPVDQRGWKKQQKYLFAVKKN